MKWLLLLLCAGVSLHAEEIVYDWNIPGFEEVVGVAQVSGPSSIEYFSSFHVDGPLQACDSTYSFACIEKFEISAGVPGGYAGEAEFNECSIGCDPGYAPFWADFPTLYDVTQAGTYYGSVSGNEDQPLTTLTISTAAPEPRTWLLASAGIAALLMLRLRCGAVSNCRVRRQ